MNNKIDAFTFAAGVVAGFLAAKTYFKRKYEPKEEIEEQIIDEEEILAEQEHPIEDIITEAYSISKDVYEEKDPKILRLTTTIKPFDPNDIRTYGDWYNYLPRSVAVELVTSRVENMRKRCFYIEDPRLGVRYCIKIKNGEVRNGKEERDTVERVLQERSCPDKVEPSEGYSCDATINI